MNLRQPFKPSGIFINDAIYYKKQLKALSHSHDQKLRYAALWALWVTARDQDSLNAWLKDAKSKDEPLRIKALVMLQKIKHEASKDLYPPLLHNPNSELKLVGLLGVKAFRLHSAFESVIKLIGNSDMVIACAATETVAELDPSRSREVLIKLLKNETLVASEAQEALKRFNSVENIDYFAKILESSELDIVQLERLFLVVLGITYQKHFYYAINDPNELQLKSLIEKWRTWWKNNRNVSKEQWLRSTIDLYVNHIVENPEARVGFTGLRYVNDLFSNRQILDSEDKEDRLRFQSWWLTNANDSLWEILSKDYYPQSTPEGLQKLDLLSDIDPARTAQFLFENVIKCRFANFQEGIHQPLSELRQYPMENPCLASCELRNEAVKDWNEWAIKVSKGTNEINQ